MKILICATKACLLLICWQRSHKEVAGSRPNEAVRKHEGTFLCHCVQVPDDLSSLR